MNNPILRKIDVPAAYAPLAGNKTVCTFTLSCPPTNAAAVYVKGDTGDDVPLVPGEWQTFQRVDLAAIQIKGNVGDIVTVVGGSW